jgi:hypothetical protein
MIGGGGEGQPPACCQYAYLQLGSCRHSAVATCPGPQPGEFSCFTGKQAGEQGDLAAACLYFNKTACI